MANRERPTARLAATLIAVAAVTASACAGPAFRNDGASGKGGSGDDTGGTSTSSGGAPGASGGSSAKGGSSGGGATSTSGGATATGGTAASGASSGGAALGGSAGAPAGGAGGSSGLGGTGGLGIGGLGLGGLLGTAGAPSGGFPSTKVLDRFARDDAELGPSWLGATDEFTIRDQQLLDVTDEGMPLLWNTKFGATQEVFATLVSFGAQAREINLVLKAQEPGSGCDLIEVLYMPNSAQVGVDFCVNGDWTDLPPLAVELQPGDQLGARVNAAGRVAVYLNGMALKTFDASAFPHKAGGYIGVNALSSADEPATWDDFGGGNATP